MPKITLSTMEPIEFARLFALVGTSQRTLAKLLGRKQATISAYMNGKTPIPMEVASNLQAMARGKVREASDALQRDLSESDLAQVLYEQRRAQPEQAEHKQYALHGRRDTSPDTHLLPAIRLDGKRAAVYARCLVAWRNEVHRRWQIVPASKEADYAAEMADVVRFITQLNTKPQGVKRVDVSITLQVCEWKVVSRALLWGDAQGIEGARTLYQYWRRHCAEHWPYRKQSGSGYEYVLARRAEKEAARIERANRPNALPCGCTIEPHFRCELHTPPSRVRTKAPPACGCRLPEFRCSLHSRPRKGTTGESDVDTNPSSR